MHGLANPTARRYDQCKSGTSVLVGRVILVFHTSTRILAALRTRIAAQLTAPAATLELAQCRRAVREGRSGESQGQLVGAGDADGGAPSERAGDGRRSQPACEHRQRLHDLHARERGTETVVKPPAKL